MADDKEPKLIGTGRTPSEQDLLDLYLLSFITAQEYLERFEVRRRVRRRLSKTLTYLAAR